MQPRHYLKSINHFKRECVLVGLEGLLSYSSSPWNSRRMWIIGFTCQIALVRSARTFLWASHNGSCWMIPASRVPIKIMSIFCLLFFMPELLCYLFFLCEYYPLLLLSFFLSSNEPIWSNEGCIRSDGNMTYSVCLCNHLTNFAILMQVVPLKVWHFGCTLKMLRLMYY